jgi:hypothetical protein
MGKLGSVGGGLVMEGADEPGVGGGDGAALSGSKGASTLSGFFKRKTPAACLATARCAVSDGAVSGEAGHECGEAAGVAGEAAAEGEDEGGEAGVTEEGSGDEGGEAGDDRGEAPGEAGGEGTERGRERSGGHW